MTWDYRNRDNRPIPGTARIRHETTEKRGFIRLDLDDVVKAMDASEDNYVTEHDICRVLIDLITALDEIGLPTFPSFYTTGFINEVKVALQAAGIRS